MIFTAGFECVMEGLKTVEKLDFSTPFKRTCINLTMVIKKIPRDYKFKTDSPYEESKQNGELKTDSSNLLWLEQVSD